MTQKIIKTLLTFLLIFFPFWGSIFLGKHTPYTEGNSLGNFIMVYALTTIIAVGVLLYCTSRFKTSFVQPVVPGIILFLMGCVMLGIAGLAAPPDLSIKMLDHPEREHFRYILLSIGLLFFAMFFLHLFLRDALSLTFAQRQLMIALVVITIVEIIWEFYHHYQYPEGLQKWVAEGNSADDFSKNYDNWKVGSIGSIGRIVIYTLILWLSVKLYKLKRITIWNPILSVVFCILGLISSFIMFFYFMFDMEAPKELGFLFLFFIPGIPFLLMYWIGIALLMKKPAAP